MKKSSVFIALALVVLCLVGWIGVGSQMAGETSMYDTYVQQADDWVEKGLYQRAISRYNLALEEQENQELYGKMNHAYQLWYEQAREDALDSYMDFLTSAVSAYPTDPELIKCFMEVFYSQSRYEDLYWVLSNTVENGYTTEEIQKMLRICRYAFHLQGEEFSGIRQPMGDIYIVSRNNLWNLYSSSQGYLLADGYDFVSPYGENGLVVVTSGTDSRIIDSSGMLWGIFEKTVTDAGRFSEGLVPACCDGEYGFYNDLGEMQFGGFEAAGAFQDGLAPVKKDGQWVLVDTAGDVKSQAFEEIVLDSQGNYLSGERFLAKSEGKYGIYNKEQELVCTLDCTDVDVYTQDKLIAVCKDDKWGFVNAEGKMVLEPTYEQAKSFSYGLAAVCVDGKWGFIDPSGTLVIECQFSDTGYMTGSGICPVCTDPSEERTEQTDEQDTENHDAASTIKRWKLLELELGIVE